MAVGAIGSVGGVSLATAAAGGGYQFAVEWRFARRFELDTTYGDAGAGGVDFAFRYRF